MLHLNEKRYFSFLAFAYVEIGVVPSIGRFVQNELLLDAWDRAETTLDSARDEFLFKAVQSLGISSAGEEALS
jgi:hypothetical protein